MSRAFALRGRAGLVAKIACVHRAAVQATDPQFRALGRENWPRRSARVTTQYMIEPISGRSLPKTGIFAVLARDFPRIWSSFREIGSTETGRRIANARHWQAFLRLFGTVSQRVTMPGWGERIRTSIWKVRNQTVSPIRGECQNRSSLNFISPSKR
jgi:hypothetical protein